MSSLMWYSGLAVFAVHIEGNPYYRTHSNLYLVQACDDRAAFDLVLRQAKLEEEQFVNADGRLVRWLLIRIETLDLLGTNLRSGQEVYSEPGPNVAVGTVNFEFSPDQHKPGSCGIMPE